ncbi:MAG: DNA mismatch repair protein MutL [Gammaproteobacteria bacterium]|jgi:DNA mismatch repair protein MutL
MTDVPARIRQLDSTVANQIAAGEVVERPSSVLKELLENCLDAGATSISVDLEHGGSRLIRVRDNGAGIHPEDLALAVLRHGTSKLREVDDLDQLHSLGFRGEALASVASVSRFVLRSRRQAEPTGWEIRLDGEAGNPVPSPCAMTPGTEVEVRDLFFNTPARRRFLRSERTELGHLEAVIQHIALVAFDVAIVARAGERRLISVRPAADQAAQLARVGTVLGRTFASSAWAIDGRGGELSLCGWVLPAHAASTTTQGQHVFLNGRYIRDAVVRHALGMAYENVLHPGQQSSYVLYLDIPPQEVNVNVHPAKTEVRYREPRAIHDFVFATVRRVLAQSPNGVGATPGTSQIVGDRSEFDEVGREVTAASMSTCATAVEVPTRSGDGGASGVGFARAAPYPPTERQIRSAVRDSTHLYGRGGGANAARTGERSPSLKSRAQTGPPTIVVGKYLLVEHPEYAIMLDMPAVLQASVAARFERMPPAPRPVGRPLLVPHNAQFPPGDVARVGKASDLLETFALVIRPVGSSTLSLRQMPAFLDVANPAGVLQALTGLATIDAEAVQGALGELARWVALSPRAVEETLEAWRILTEIGQPLSPQWGWVVDEPALARALAPPG